MKTHTTNYVNTFIQVAEDCPASTGEIPPDKGDSRTVAGIQFEILHKHPYEFTSDDVLFQVYAERNDLPAAEQKTARQDFFSKGQPCFRASPLAKRYGWGVHSDQDGKVAIYACDTPMYRKLSGDKSLTQLKAMRTNKK